MAKTDCWGEIVPLQILESDFRGETRHPKRYY